MSFIDDIVSGASKILGSLVGGSSLGGNILKTILTGFALNQVTKSINKDNAKDSAAQRASTIQPDSGTTLQIPPAGENKIPVVYGQALIGGIITDVRMSGDNQTMWYVVTICEVTGTKLSDSLPSEFRFNYVYLNGNRVVFKADGLTVDYTIDPSGNIDRSVSGQVQVFCYSNGSNSPTSPYHFTVASLQAAYNVMPNWTVNHLMDNLVFAIVKVTYNKEKNVTGMPNMSFNIRNSMTLPGDCLYDYMTSTRYGAGIDPQEIKSA
jgi:hypothetical protein